MYYKFFVLDGFVLFHNGGYSLDDPPTINLIQLSTCLNAYQKLLDKGGRKLGEVGSEMLWSCDRGV